MRLKTVCAMAGLAAAVSLPAAAEAGSGTNIVSITANVPGVANLWLAGMPAGSTAGGGYDVAPDESPLEILGVSSNAAVFTFAVVGGVANGPHTLQGPDGIAGCIVSRNPGAENGIGDLHAPLDALVGVFLDDTDSTNAPQASALDFSSDSARNFRTLEPSLRQPFFIGDGRTSSGEVQQIVAPATATRLFLGVMDGYEWSNNRGSFTVKIGVEQSGSQ